MEQQDWQDNDDTLFVGIDLGTSRSAIAASNGKRIWIDSYVGWPKDFVARKVLGQPVLFGEQALHHRLSLDLYRPLERGVIKEGTTRDQEAVMELIRHLIEASARRRASRSTLWSAFRPNPSRPTSSPSGVAWATPSPP